MIRRMKPDFDRETEKVRIFIQEASKRNSNCINTRIVTSNSQVMFVSRNIKRHIENTEQNSHSLLASIHCQIVCMTFTGKSKFHERPGLSGVSFTRPDSLNVFSEIHGIYLHGFSSPLPLMLIRESTCQQVDPIRDVHRRKLRWETLRGECCVGCF